MKDFWDTRYSEETYAYGTAPNLFFSTTFKNLNPGKALFPAEGEGRNAVFAASCGWEVVAFDQSEVGKAKALQLATEKGVEIDYKVTSLSEFKGAQESFDALVLIYAHFPEALRNPFHQKLSQMVKPGGHLLLEGFSKRHLEYNSVNASAGGPKELSMLFSLEELASDFSDFEIQFSEETTVELNEGLYHVGDAAVVRLICIKK
jgi:cyclopropane fatty-acyl-phospholipid synthase-like methyltransferase